jgi:hypothetical protein
LSAALAGCNGEGGTTVEYLNNNTPNQPSKNPDPAGFTVSYQKGNGAGILPESKLITEKNITDGDNKITLPGKAGLKAPEADGTAVFVGWNDGTLTYTPEYEYTVTKNVTFNARWAFTMAADITACLEANDDTVVIAVADAEPPDESDITWQNLLTAIASAGKYVELDLSESTLALVDGNKFDYRDYENVYKTGGKFIKKLVLPRKATFIKNNFLPDTFSSLAAVSGLKVSAIPDNAFKELSTLAAVVFPVAESIGSCAFLKCYALTSLSIPAVKTITAAAFQNCYTLTSVSLPMAGTIGMSGFQNCYALTSVSLPATTLIDIAAFENCNNLTTITIKEGCTVEDYTIRGGFQTYYNANNQYGEKAAGVYTYNTGKSSWSYEPLPVPKE